MSQLQGAQAVPVRSQPLMLQTRMAATSPPRSKQNDCSDPDTHSCLGVCTLAGCLVGNRHYMNHNLVPLSM